MEQAPLLRRRSAGKMIVQVNYLGNCPVALARHEAILLVKKEKRFGTNIVNYKCLPKIIKKKPLFVTRNAATLTAKAALPPVSSCGGFPVLVLLFS